MKSWALSHVAVATIHPQKFLFQLKPCAVGPSSPSPSQTPVFLLPVTLLFCGGLLIFFFMVVRFFFETGTLRYSGWPGAHYTDQADLRSAAILLLLPLVCWDCRYATHLFSVWIWPSQGPQTSSHRAAVFYVRLVSSYTRSSQFTYVSASVKVSLLISKDD